MRTSALKMLGVVGALAMLLGAANHAVGQAPTDGLVGYWNLDEGDGSTANDSGPNGYHGLLTGLDQPVWTAGKVGGAVYFNLTSYETPSMCDITPDGLKMLAAGDGYTLAAWVNPASVPSPGLCEHSVAVGQCMNNNASGNIIGFNSAGKFSMRHIYNNGTPQLVTATAGETATLGEWCHVVGVVDKTAGTAKLYTNGVLAASTNWTPNSADPGPLGYTWKFGAWGGNRDAGNGTQRLSVDEVRMYNRALSAVEVALVYGDGWNAAPTVSIVAPAGGTSFRAPADVTIHAEAADPDGTIVKVEFYESGSKLGEDEAAPYRFDWTNVPSGRYSLTAVATDNEGGMGTSDVVNVEMNDPPTVSISEPTNGAAFTLPTDITIQATAADSDGYVDTVEFFEGADKLGEALDEPWEFAWTNAGAGLRQLTAVATDGGGMMTTSSVIGITVTDPANQPPDAVTIVAPANGAAYRAPATVTIQVTASDADGTIARVEFFRGTTRLGETNAQDGGYYTYVWSGAPAGSYALTARATDDKGGVKTSAAVLIELNDPPAVSISMPTNGAVFVAPTDVTIEATAADSDGTIAKVEFYRDATKLGEDAVAPYSFAWTNVAAGDYSLTAVATDDKGAMTTSAPPAAISVTARPTVGITSPAEAARYTLAPAAVVIQATAADADGIARVEFFEGSNKIGEDLAAPYSFDWTNVAAGGYSLTAVATDGKGLTATSGVVTISVNARPTVSITTPEDGAFFTPPAIVSIEATAADGDGTVAKVEFYQGATKLGEDSSAPYAFTWMSVAPGEYSLTAVATDNEGAPQSSAAVRIKVTVPGYGPGGVGRLDGVTGPRMWCRADDSEGVLRSDGAGGYTPAGDGGRVHLWRDRSGLTDYGPYGNRLDGVNDTFAPTLSNNVANGLPMVYFDDAAQRRLYGPAVSPSNTCLKNGTFTIMVVNQRTLQDHQESSFLFQVGQDKFNGPPISEKPALSLGYVRGMGLNRPQYYAVDKDGNWKYYNSGGGSVTLLNVMTVRLAQTGVNQGNLYGYYNGNYISGLIAPSTWNFGSGFTNYQIRVGWGKNAWNEEFMKLIGFVGEIVVYGRGLAESERIIVDNHLAAKYGITMEGNDVYAGDEPVNGDYDFDVIGIGGTADGTNAIASGGGLTIEASGGTLNNNEFLLAGHNAGGNDFSTDRVPMSGFLVRWSRAWYLDSTGALDGDITFDWVESGMSDTASGRRQVLLYSPSLAAEFVIVESEARVSGTATSFTVPNVQDGYYTVGVRSQTGGMLIVE